MPADPLESLLEAYEPTRPRIVWYSRAERIELTGHVLSMWQSKTAGLITAETAPGAPVHLGAPVHWRTVAWACGAWLAGRTLVLGPGEQAGGLTAGAGIDPAGLSMALAESELDPEAEVQVLVPAPSLAVRWPGQLPALVIDGAAELMSYADTFSPVAAPASALGLIQASAGGAGGREGPAQCLTRAQLAAGCGQGGAVHEPDEARPERTGDESDTGNAAEDAGATAGTPAPAASRRGAALVRASDPGIALRQVLGAWRQGRTAVILEPGADDGLAASAARQEGAHL